MRARDVLAQLLRAARRGPSRPAAPPGTRPSAGRTRTGTAPRGGTSRSAAPPDGRYPGDHTGAVHPVYAPDLDGDPDPGEIVWTWVPFEEDHSRGKDRPVLLVGHDGPWLLALLLSTRDQDARPNGRGESWLDLGAGEWDSLRRPSEVRLDRVIRVDPGTVRREGAVLDRPRFDTVVAALRSRRR